MKLSDSDLRLIAKLSKSINRTAYHDGLGLEESGKYLGVLDRILAAHGTSVDDLVDTAGASEDEQRDAMARGLRRLGF
jgi:hypothetical protein